MKKSRIIIIASIVVVAVLVKTKTNFWRTITEDHKNGMIERSTPYVFFMKHGMEIYFYEYEYFHGYGSQTPSFMINEAKTSRKAIIPWARGKRHGTEIEYYADGSKIKSSSKTAS